MPVSLSIGAHVNSLTAHEKVQPSRDVESAAAQRPPDQNGVPAPDEREKDAIALTARRHTAPPAAEERIRNAAFAAEAANHVKTQMSEQPALAVMAQANASPQAVLALLRG
jgi:flagellin